MHVCLLDIFSRKHVFFQNKEREVRVDEKFIEIRTSQIPKMTTALTGCRQMAFRTNRLSNEWVA